MCKAIFSLKNTAWWIKFVVCFLFVFVCIDFSQAAESENLYFENEELSVTVDGKTLALKIVNKKTDYEWSSTIQQMEQENLNKAWQDFVQSAITIDYLTNNQKIRREYVSDKGTKINLKEMKDGFKAVITFKSKIKLTLECKIDGNHVQVSIPEDRIVEPVNAKLYELYVYPFLGNTKKNLTEGYMFIPDGSGALISYQDTVQMTSPYSAPVYGEDIGVSQESFSDEVVAPHSASIPVFGAVHGEYQNAFLADIMKGEEYAKILAYKSGLSTDFNWLTSVYSYRYSYKKFVNQKSQSSELAYQKERNPVDLRIKYSFLSNEEASYVGMAKSYQHSLLQRGIFQADAKGKQPFMQLQFFGGQSKEGIFSSKLVEMTTIADIKEFMKRVSSDGLEDLIVGYEGWTKGGLSHSYPNHFPIENRLGSKENYHELVQWLKSEGIPFYLQMNYGLADSAPKKIKTKKLSEGLNGKFLSSNRDGVEYYYLLPQSIKELVDLEHGQLEEMNVEHLTITQLGSLLYTTANKEYGAVRSKNKEKIMDTLEALKKSQESLGLEEPNLYAWQYMDRYVNIPMGNSEYIYETESVPFLQIVLKGYIPYYTPYFNFVADQEKMILQTADFGANPSFLLTKEEPIELIDTASKDIYTSQYDAWYPKLLEAYRSLDVLKNATKDSSIINRKKVSEEVYQIDYDNQISVIVNYSSTDFQLAHHLVKAKEFIVLKGGEAGEKIS